MTDSPRTQMATWNQIVLVSMLTRYVRYPYFLGGDRMVNWGLGSGVRECKSGGEVRGSREGTGREQVSINQKRYIKNNIYY